MRRKFTLMLSAIAMLALVALNNTIAFAEQPASPGQLNAWKSQKATLQAEQGKAQSERAALPGQQRASQAEIDRLEKMLKGETLAGAAAAASGKAVLQGANPYENRTVDQRAFDNLWGEGVRHTELKTLQKEEKAKLAVAKTRQAQLDAEIPARADQIAQLDRTIAYYENPLKSELDNQNDRLENYRRQRRSNPDPGLDADIKDAERRIKELNDLQKQFQEGGGSSNSGGSSGPSGGQPQPQSYVAPTGSSGTEPQSQVPVPGYVTGYIGAPPVYGSPVAPRWTDLNPSASSRQHSAGPAGGGTAPSKPGAPPTVIAQTPVTPGGTQTPPASGGQCSQPICYRSGQTDCDNSVPISVPTCYANMLKRCNQGMAGGTGGWCVHKGADPSCEARAQRVCDEASKQGVWDK